MLLTRYCPPNDDMVKPNNTTRSGNRTQDPMLSSRACKGAVNFNVGGLEFCTELMEIDCEWLFLPPFMICTLKFDKNFRKLNWDRKKWK